MFSGDIKRDQWHEMGQVPHFEGGAYSDPSVNGAAFI